MSTLVYKRTRTGDPNERGIFGNHGCMGRVRGLEFDSVIGIGGTCAEAKSHRINGKINWIGIGAHKVGWYIGGPLIAFKYFQTFNTDGDELILECQALEDCFYTHPAPRYVLNDFSDEEQAEIDRLLATVKNKPPSKDRQSPKGRGKCPPRSGPDGC